MNPPNPFHRYSWPRYGITLLFALGGCGGSPTKTTTTPHQINYGDTHDTTFSKDLPAAGTGYLTLHPGPDTEPGFCSGALIKRDVVLTASHCFCLVRGNPAARVQFTYRSNSGSIERIGASPSRPYALKDPGYPCGDADIRERDDDIALVFLDRPVPVAHIPKINEFYPGGDFLDRLRNIMDPGPWLRLFGSPVEITGLSSTDITYERLFPSPGASPSFARETGTLGKLHFDYDCGFAGAEDCSGFFVWTTQDPGAVAEKGDSGGPWTFRNGERNGAPTIFAVTSGSEEQIFDDKHVGAVAFDNGRGNGSWISSFLDDADNDGVLDSHDNCPPARCPYSTRQCANEDQRDEDSDGVGDACDNCSPATCRFLGWAPSHCANADQRDRDNDHKGDTCDLCPLHPGDNFDPDHDGVAQACDNCDQKNGYRACRSSADCDSNECLLATNNPFGRCTVWGTACRSDSDCNGTNCLGIGTYGRCLMQLDDLDRDGIGGQCDNCPTVAETRVLRNSNIDKEAKEFVPGLGDVCDPVPFYSLSPIQGLMKGNRPMGINGSTARSLSLFASAGLGVGGTSNAVTGRVGFRYCSCVNGVSTLSAEECKRTLCPIPTEFPGGAAWVPISVEASGTLTLPPESTPPPAGQEISRNFTPDIKCDDQWSSAGERCHVGGSQEVIRWYHEEDIRNDKVPATPGGATAGFLWTHVIDGAYASSRDQMQSGRLRDTFSYVKTPYVTVIPDTPVPVGTDCIGFGCEVSYVRDWLSDPADSLVSRMRDLVTRPSKLTVGADGSLYAWRDGMDSAVDVSSYFQPELRDFLATHRDLSWLSPNEPAVRGKLGASSTAQALSVALPGQWRQSFGRPIALVENPKGFMLQGGGGSGLEGKFVPADRDDARALFSATQQSVFLVGGHLADGASTGEFWRYSLTAGEWQHLFTSPSASRIRPEDVRAIAFHDRTNRLLALDVPRASVAVGEPTARLLLFDVAQETVQVLARFPMKGRYDRVALSADESGVFYLFTSSQAENTWAAHRLTIMRAGMPLFTGSLKQSGQLIDDPFRTTEGIQIPTTLNKQRSLLLFDPSKLGPPARPSAL